MTEELEVRLQLRNRLTLRKHLKQEFIVKMNTLRDRHAVLKCILERTTGMVSMAANGIVFESKEDVTFFQLGYTGRL